jgi:hypothetical protein
MPRKVPSTMNAIMPSRASGPPYSSPAVREKAAKLVPNSNSRTRPVTVPTTKLTAKMRVQNRRNCSWMTFPERISFQVKYTRKGTSPIVTTGR